MDNLVENLKAEILLGFFGIPHRTRSGKKIRTDTKLVNKSQLIEHVADMKVG